MRSPPQSSLLQPEQTRSPQMFLLSPWCLFHHLGRPPLDTPSEPDVLLLLSCPKVPPALELWLQQCRAGQVHLLGYPRAAQGSPVDAEPCSSGGSEGFSAQQEGRARGDFPEPDCSCSEDKMKENLHMCPFQRAGAGRGCGAGGGRVCSPGDIRNPGCSAGPRRRNP